MSNRDSKPLDGLDFEILEGVREYFTAADPLPPDLVERVRFAIELEQSDVECLRRSADQHLLAATRGEQNRTVTFDSDSLTIMIRIGAGDSHRVRLDGWLAPPTCCAIELRSRSMSLHTTPDDQGRFAFEGVPRGLVQLVVEVADGSAAAHRPIVTPSIVV